MRSRARGVVRRTCGGRVRFAQSVSVACEVSGPDCGWWVRRYNTVMLTIFFPVAASLLLQPFCHFEELRGGYLVAWG
jgi:hypothetical protein